MAGNWRKSLLLAGLLWPLAVHAAEFGGRVVAIGDGDTLTVQTGDNRRVRVRLAGIDAPEHDQPYGAAATRSLTALALNRIVRVRRVAEDDYGRVVGAVVADGRDLDAEQIRRGMAWVYRRYARSRRLYALEAEAKQARRGLWADPNPIPPWDWRHGGKSSTPSPSPSPSASFQCGAKRTCREMVSCEEARFYLDRCGVKRLDSDKDGTPCEALCR
ncbi:MAG: thermonuclease family protein [Candidatus Competibacter sp.]|nr:thermonuclease family protein [Candidatus Competibacter sp.]MDG4582913.1 thermonuclease family protein [Candidatus Competibacter sp.]